MNYERVMTVFLLVTTTAAPGFGQTLAEVARKEEERRKRIAAPARVYTNSELRSERASTAAAVPPSTTEAASLPVSAAAPAAGAGATVAKPVDKPIEDPKKNEAHWRQRMQQARDAAQRAEVVVAALQSRIDALLTDFVNRDDPAQQARIAADRDTALQELDRVKKEMQQLAKGTADIQDEARRAGVPPGWVR